MKITQLITLTALLAAMPAMAQMKDSMSSGGKMSSDKMAMSDSDMKMMKSCKKMSNEMMMKNKKCAAMMKMHPDMMKGDDMMMKK